jgi:hypothetical protein
VSFKIAQLVQDGSSLVYRAKGESDRVMAALPVGAKLTQDEINAVEALWVCSPEHPKPLGPVQVARKLRQLRALPKRAWPTHAELGT